MPTAHQVRTGIRMISARSGEVRWMRDPYLHIMQLQQQRMQDVARPLPRFLVNRSYRLKEPDRAYTLACAPGFNPFIPPIVARNLREARDAAAELLVMHTTGMGTHELMALMVTCVELETMWDPHQINARLTLEVHLLGPRTFLRVVMDSDAAKERLERALQRRYQMEQRMNQVTQHGDGSY